ncbi:hypothetical protein Tco_0676961 [Tanacetum coccineum]
MESSNSNSRERELQLTQLLIKQRHSHCMTWFEQLKIHLRDLYLNNSSYALRLQLKRENLHEVNAKTCLEVLRTQFKEFFASKGVNSSDHLNQCWQQDFKEYMLCEPDTYKRDLLENLDTLKAVIHRAVITYGILRMKENEFNALKVNGKQLNEEILHEHEIKKSLKLPLQDVQINLVQAVDDSLIVSKSSWIESENNNALSKSVNETQLQQHESLVTESTTLEDNLNADVKALDDGSVITESSRTKSDKHDTSSRSGNYITHVVDADITPVNDQVPFAKVQLTAQHNVLANEQQHSEQFEPIYNTYLLGKVDSNTTPGLKNMCHRGGEIDQNAEQYQVKSPLLNDEFSKTKDMVEKEVYNELLNRFLQLEKHCILLEISIQQKEESFQSNKPCKNQDSSEFREFFEINKLKAQLQAKNSTINNLKKQIKNVHEKSNEAKVKHDIDVIETINIELEHKVAKLLKENETLKKHYKDLYDSIKVTRTKTIEQTTSLIAKNDEFKAQLQEKGFTIAALKNKLRKLTGNSVNTKFAKPSILGKPVLQPPRNQSVVRQPNAFKSERPNFSKPRFASQVDVNNVLSKPVTPHYLPKVQEYVLAKPHHVIAPGSSRNSQEESYGSNDMAHNHYLEEARKKTQERNRNSKSSVMHTTSLQITTNGSKQKPRSNNQTSRSLPVSKSSCGMSNGVSLVDHSRNSSSFSDSKHFVCSTCHKCVFNANHDNCITKFLKEVNSRAKVQSPKSRNNIKPAKRIPNVNKPERWISKGYRFSPNKSSAMHEKPNTLLDLVLGGNQRVEFLRLFVLGGYLLERCSSIAQPKLTVNLQMVQMMISLTHMNAIKLFMLVQEFKEFKSDEHASNDVCSHQFRPSSSS